jgi:hypothetical protein
VASAISDEFGELDPVGEALGDGDPLLPRVFGALAQAANTIARMPANASLTGRRRTAHAGDACCEHAGGGRCEHAASTRDFISCVS